MFCTLIADPAAIPVTPAKSTAGAANGGSVQAHSATPSSASSSSTLSKSAASGMGSNYVILHLSIHKIIKTCSSHIFYRDFIHFKL